MKKNTTSNLLLENRFTSHQQTHIILSIGAPLLIIIFKLSQSTPSFYVHLQLFGFSLLYIVLFCLAFTKRGLININNNLYRGLYFRKQLILKKKIDITNKTKIAVLKFKRRQKMAWFSAARPDLDTIYNHFDITLLNDKHTVKEKLISLEKEKFVDLSIEFLEQNFCLVYEQYSPDFS